MSSSSFFTVLFLATILVHHSVANETTQSTPSTPTADDVPVSATTATITGHNKLIHNESSASINIRSYYANTSFNNKDSAYAKFREDNEQTLLDLFGERAKELLTQHIIPSTDIHCNWDWQMGKSLIVLLMLSLHSNTQNTLRSRPVRAVL